MKTHFKLILLPAVLAGTVFLSFGCGEQTSQGEPPAPDVIATFDGGMITWDQLERQYRRIMSCHRAQYEGLEGRKRLIRGMIFPQVIGRFIKERKIDLREGIREAMGNLTDEMNLSFLHMKIHEKIMDSDERFSGLRDEYEMGKERVMGLPISERYGELVRLHEQLHPRMAQEVEEYLERYIEDLRRNAAITVDYDVLRVDVTDRELRDFYQRHRDGYHKDEYVEPAKVKVSQIQIETVSEEAGDCASCAREQAEKALVELRSGASFEEVAGKYSQGPYAAEGGRVPDYIAKGSRGRAFDDAVFSLHPGEISEVFRDGDSFYIVRLEEKMEERQKDYREILDQLRLEYQWEKSKQHLEQNRDRVLFTLDGRRYTVGDFLKELRRTTPRHQCRHGEGILDADRPAEECKFAHHEPESQRELVDRMIERELIVEDTYAQMIQVEYKEEIDQVKVANLYPIFHDEEMEGLIDVTDGMVREHYEKNKEKYMTPAEARISYILIKGGRTREEREKAFQKAREAHRRLKPPFYLFEDGEDFAEVARRYSEDEETRLKGGQLDQNVFECRDALEYMTMHGFHRRIFELEPGEISDPFEFNGDYYIVQLRELVPRKQKPFEEVETLIGEELTVRQHGQVMETWEDNILKSADLVIYDSAIKRLLDKGKSEEEKVAQSH